MTTQEALGILGLPDKPTPEEVRSRFVILWHEGMAAVKGARSGQDWHLAQKQLDRLSQARMALVGMEFGR